MFICIKGIVEERLDIIFSATKSKRSKKEKASKIYIDEVTTGNVSEDGNVEYFVNWPTCYVLEVTIPRESCLSCERINTGIEDINNDWLFDNANNDAVGIFLLKVNIGNNRTMCEI